MIDVTMKNDILGELENLIDEYCCDVNHDNIVDDEDALIASIVCSNNHDIDGDIMYSIIDMIVNDAFSPNDLTSNELHHLMLACDVIVGWHDGEECPYHDNGEEDDEDNCEIVRHNISQFKAMLGA